MLGTTSSKSAVGAKYALLTGILLCTIALVIVQFHGDYLSMDSFRQAILDSGSIGPIASVGLMILHGLLPVPVEFLSAANGVVFGFWGGVMLTWLGMMLAAWAGYGIARLTGSSILRFVPDSAVGKSRTWVGKGGWWKLLLARQMPFVSFWAMNLALGILKVSFLRFTWTTALGNVPYVVVIALVASSVS